MDIIICSICKSENEINSEYCVNCGCELKGLTPQKKELPVQSEDSIAEILNSNSNEEKFFSVCYKCGNFNFTYRSRIENTIKSNGCPTCVWCGGKIKILAGKEQWMNKDKLDRENIVDEEIQKVSQGNNFNQEMAQQYGKGRGLRPDLDFQGYCPKCAMYYPKSSAVRKGITTCEFCGTTIKYSNILTEDFTDLFNKEKEKMGIDVLKDDKPISNFIKKTFLLEEELFDEVIYNKRINPEQYMVKQTTQQYIPKCPICGSPNIVKISAISKVGSVALWGIFSRKAYKQWHCNNCGSDW